MFGLSPATRILLFTGQTDLRKGYDGLAALVAAAGESVYSGDLYVFVSGRRTSAKILMWQTGGLDRHLPSEATTALATDEVKSQRRGSTNGIDYDLRWSMAPEPLDELEAKLDPWCRAVFKMLREENVQQRRQLEANAQQIAALTAQLGLVTE